MSASTVLPRPVLRFTARRGDGRDGSGSRASARKARPDETSRSPRRVLVVDDDPGLRLICRFNLEAAGMEVLEAGDGATALELATADPPDVILLDVMMPGMDGWTVAAELRRHERTRAVPVVFVTARGSDVDRGRGVDLDAAAYLTKPFDPSTLTDLIARLVSGQEGG